SFFSKVYFIIKLYLLSFMSNFWGAVQLLKSPSNLGLKNKSFPLENIPLKTFPLENILLKNP
ncbi:MAG: hypothetical protein J1F43_08980, partial [Muribaculaceae bacterium]|nr:hypothetical protein [Muribaculaceae bacterium]